MSNGAPRWLLYKCFPSFEHTIHIHRQDNGSSFVVRNGIDSWALGEGINLYIDVPFSVTVKGKDSEMSTAINLDARGILFLPIFMQCFYFVVNKYLNLKVNVGFTHTV